MRDASHAACANHVRFTPKSGHEFRILSSASSVASVLLRTRVMLAVFCSGLLTGADDTDATDDRLPNKSKRHLHDQSASTC
jgi:hypothetical protein